MVRVKVVLLKVSRGCAVLGVVFPFGAVLVLVAAILGWLLASHGWITADAWPPSLRLAGALLPPGLSFIGLIMALLGLPSWPDRSDTWPVLSVSLGVGLSLFAGLYLVIPVMTWLYGP